MPDPYSAAPQQSDSSGGVGHPFLSEAARIAAFRVGQTRNAILQGPMVTEGRGWLSTAFRGTFGWRAADDEMTRWRAGGSIPRQAYGWATGRKTSWIEAGVSPSMWMTSAQIYGGGASREAWRILERNIMKNPSGAHVNPFSANNKYGVADKRFPLYADGHNRIHERGVGKYGGTMSEAESEAWVREALKLGKTPTMKFIPSWVGDTGLGKAVGKRLIKYGIDNEAYVKDLVTGMFWGPKTVSAVTGGMSTMTEAGVVYRDLAGKFVSKTAAEMAHAADLIESKSAIARAIGRGKYLRLAGKEAGLQGTKLLPLLQLAGKVGTLYSYYALAEAAYNVGKAAWKVGDLYFSKIPRHYYRNMNSVMTRPAFAPVAAAMPDSPVAANNRQRAIQAIQGSRLNARSAIGREASPMASHFG